MPAVTLFPEDLAPFAVIDAVKAEAMIDDALALAVLVAPCIVSDDFQSGAAARAVLRGAILRWHESGSGAVSQQSAGPFAQTLDTRQQRRGMFWPSEIEALQGLCRGSEVSGAFAVDTSWGSAPQHADICSANFGALYCSCGAILTGAAPLWEQA